MLVTQDSVILTAVVGMMVTTVVEEVVGVEEGQMTLMVAGDECWWSRSGGDRVAGVAVMVVKGGGELISEEEAGIKVEVVVAF